MNNVTYIKASAVALLALLASPLLYANIVDEVARINGLRYACVRGNTMYESNIPAVSRINRPDMYFSSSFGFIVSYPKSVEDIFTPSDLDGGAIDLWDCSTESFFCVKVRQSYLSADPPKWNYVLVVPKELVANQEYDFSGVHIIVAPALVNGNNGAPRMQVTLWQKINSINTAIELTIERGRGVIYWDGFKLTQSDPSDGQLCTLFKSQYGLFYQVGFKELTP